MEQKRIGNQTSDVHHTRPAWEQPKTGGLWLSEPEKHAMYQLPDPAIVIRGDAVVRECRDVFYFGPIGSGNRTVTVTFRPMLMIDAGCFHGDLVQFIREVEMKQEGSQDRLEYEAMIAAIQVLARTRCK